MAVNLYNKKVIHHSKSIHGTENIKKLIFFSDGGGAQYKNKSKLINMIYLQKETGIKVHWNFFATAHGKGACDGIGGTVKRLAHRGSLQRTEHSQITTPKGLFEWAVGRFENFFFRLSTTAKCESEQEFLKSRFQKQF